MTRNGSGRQAVYDLGVAIPRRARLPRGTLTTDVVLDAAGRVVRDSGASGLTMTALAAELGADRTAVYRHFANKDALMTALIDRVLDDVQGISPDLDAGAQLRALGTHLRETLRRHQGAVVLFAEMPFTPASARLVGRAYTGLTTAGMAPDRAVDAVQAVISFVLGFSIEEDPSGEEPYWAGLVVAARAVNEISVLQSSEHWLRPEDQRFSRGLDLLIAGAGADP